MTTTITPMADAPSQDLAQLLAQLRPRLHRYCARMAGSALDGEDIVQEAYAPCWCRTSGCSWRAG